MKVMLTGATGMVGRNILEREGEAGHEFIGLSSKDLDLTDYAQVLDYLNDLKPDFIIHSAGRVGGIQANIASPVDFLVDNLEMGKNLLLAAERTGVASVLNLGSSCMYPRNISDLIPEEAMLTGELEPTNEGYALAKIVTAKLGEYINKQSQRSFCKTIIPCNLYGRHDSFSEANSHLIPAIIKKVHDAKCNDESTVEIWGDGTARREFMYAGDLADFIHLAVDRFDDLPELLNIGLGSDYSVNEYYQAVADVAGYRGQFVHDLDRPVGMKRKCVSVEKLNRFGWQAKYSLVDGIKETYRFYLEECLG